MWWRADARSAKWDPPGARPARTCTSKCASAAWRRTRANFCSRRCPRRAAVPRSRPPRRRAKAPGPRKKARRPSRPRPRLKRARSPARAPRPRATSSATGRSGPRDNIRGFPGARSPPVRTGPTSSMVKFLQSLRRLAEALWRVPTRLFGSRNERVLKQYSHNVAAINALEPEIARLADAALAGKTGELRKRHADGATLDELLPEAFAVVREASKRTLRMRHFDVQLLGGMVLHNGKIGEMKTGEGKTLVATLPAYLNALTGKGVHIVTVNDYLARRDAEWMGKIYQFLGLSVGVNLPHMDPQDKRAAYAADITYGTNNEFGFDYLRDNMAMHVEERFQRGLNYAIVDEVDSILIDEARTPLIISGQAEDRTEVYHKLNEVPPLLTRQKEEKKLDQPEPPGDFYVDEKNHQIVLSEAGHEKAEQILTRIGMLPEGASLYEPAYINLVHHLYAALRAHHLFHRDQHYVVQNGDVIIVDEFTGRLMQGRRWSDGLHQAVEAKEGVAIQNENQTLASITFQNYFRMYGKLAGMTGTADTEAYEFQQIYGLETVVVPTHRPMVRDDKQDQVYRTGKEKYDAVIKDIRDCFERAQPVLVGTTSIE